MGRRHLLALGLLVALAAGSTAAMNPEELLGKLERVRKTKDGWIALCPAHADKSPSLSVGVGQDAQILLRCFAGCSPEAVVEALGLRMVDLFPPKDASRGPQPARQVPRVERWLQDSRGFPESELAELFATEGPRGATVVFRYRDDRGRVLYDKYRALESKRFWRRPTGTPSALYGLWRLPVARPERMVVVEGELDAHALWCLGIDAVSVPDGCGSRLASELLAPLAPFRQIILAVDSDPAGDELASRLATALHPERCLRARFQPHKDANDALRAGWQLEEFEKAISIASPCSTSTNKSPPASSSRNATR